MKLIVGLGNPGAEYAGTRHNVGFEVMDVLAYRLGLTRTAEDFDRAARSKFGGLTLEAAAGGDKLLLLKPLTFMNLSGQSVQAAMAFYQMTPTDVLVVLDDLALACGKLRLRGSGSAGGHNGLKDIERALGTQEYGRLRIGIDAPPGRQDARNYVLERFSKDQRPRVDEAVVRAAEAVMMWVENGLAAAMNLFNGELQS